MLRQRVSEKEIKEMNIQLNKSEDLLNGTHLFMSETDYSLNWNRSYMNVSAINERNATLMDKVINYRRGFERL